jgi:hypothetical protein
MRDYWLTQYVLPAAITLGQAQMQALHFNSCVRLFHRL